MQADASWETGTDGTTLGNIATGSAYIGRHDYNEVYVASTYDWYVEGFANWLP